MNDGYAKGAQVDRFSVTLRVEEGSELSEMMLSGELDFSQTSKVLDSAATALTNASMRRLVVDLTGVSFIDSSGVGALINVYRMTRASGRTVTLRDPTAATAAVLRITAVDRLFAESAQATETGGTSADL